MQWLTASSPNLVQDQIYPVHPSDSSCNPFFKSSPGERCPRINHLAARSMSLRAALHLPRRGSSPPELSENKLSTTLFLTASCTAKKKNFSIQSLSILCFLQGTTPISSTFPRGHSAEVPHSSPFPSLPAPGRLFAHAAPALQTSKSRAKAMNCCPFIINPSQTRLF